jgi:hypothetical protein
MMCSKKCHVSKDILKKVEIIIRIIPINPDQISYNADLAFLCSLAICQ